MTNWIFAIIIGVVIGVIGGFVLRSRSQQALWLSPVLAIVGALIAAALGAAFGHAGYGYKKAGLEVVLALVGVGVAAVMSRRSGVGAGSSTTTR